MPAALSERRPVIERLVPAIGWLRAYERGWLRRDVLAGTTAAAVVIPQAMGYASVAGLPVEAGVYTCIVPMIVYALLGGSRRLSISTTSTVAALTGLALGAAGVGRTVDDAFAVATNLTFLVGVALIVFRALRLGWIVEAVSEATITGLKLGVGLTIIADQLPKLLGIPAARGGFAADVANAATRLDAVHIPTVAIAIGTIAGLLTLRHRASRVPGPLIALVVGIGLVAIFGLADRGVALIPDVPTGLPLPAFPSLEYSGVLLPFAFAIALMSYFESLTAARIARQPDDPALDNNREYVAVAAATIAGAIFRTLPSAGGFSQTQVNADAGAQTQVSELVTAAWAVIIALFLAPVLSDMPTATLGAIVVVAVSGLISIPDLVRLGRIDRLELLVAMLTAVAAVAANLLMGVMVGVALTFYLVLRALNHPVIVELRRSPQTGELVPARPGDDPIPGMLVLRIEGGLYTLNIRRVQAEIYARVAALDPPSAVVLLDVGGTADTSVTVMDVIAETHRQLDRQGISLWVAALPSRALAKAQRTAAWSEWSEAGRVHPTVAAAVDVHLRS